MKNSGKLIEILIYASNAFSIDATLESSNPRKVYLAVRLMKLAEINWND